MKTYDLKSAFEVYKCAVERKSALSEKQELKSIEKPMGECYSNYETHFINNDLEYLPKSSVGKSHSGVLVGLYGSQTSLVKDFRKRYFEINPQTYNNLCPYCVINSSNTTEHILPKESYPEYAVNVKNLIPCCGECNSAKGDDVLDENGKKLVINYYTDILPDEQFLFIEIKNTNGTITFDYLLSNPDGKIDSQLYALIERHFERLGLLKRYKDKAIQEFAEIKNTYVAENFTDEDEYNVFANKQMRIYDMNILEYGRNHWKMVLLRACAQSLIFKNYIFLLIGMHN